MYFHKKYLGPVATGPYHYKKALFNNSVASFNPHSHPPEAAAAKREG